MITVTPHAAPAAENPVDGLRKADGEPLEGARERAVLCNLEPAKLRGVESNGMVLAAEDERDVGLLTPEGDAPLGTQILGAKGAPRSASWAGPQD